jgi:predicted enzyme related to lactoylglutathione lyase
MRSDPFDVMEAGRMAVLLDPAGAALALWQAGKHIGSALVNEPGAVCWTELLTTNRGAAAAFYSALFGWQPEATAMGGTTYTVFRAGEVRVAGMTDLPPAEGPNLPHWLTYFAVESCDDTARRAKEMGARIVVPPSDIPSIGRFSVLTDRESAAFGVVEQVG